MADYATNKPSLNEILHEGALGQSTLGDLCTGSLQGGILSNSTHIPYTFAGLSQRERVFSPHRRAGKGEEGRRCRMWEGSQDCCQDAHAGDWGLGGDPSLSITCVQPSYRCWGLVGEVSPGPCGRGAWIPHLLP